MNIKQAKEQIENTVKAYLNKDSLGNYRIPAVRQRPVLLIGPPGIGKTAIMEQIARECGIGLVAYTITHHTRQSAVGLPYINKKNYGGKEYTVTEYTMSEIIGSVYEYMERSGLKEGILFIDEINCVSETLAPTMLQFLQFKTFGSYKVPDGWIIAAAGNPPEYNRSVREFDIVTLDRVRKLDMEADYAVWLEYAYRKGIHGAILSYLDIKKDHFYAVEASAGGKQFATARGWEDLSELLYAYEELSLPVDAAVVGGFIQHKKIASDFSDYLELYYKYKKAYRISEILEGHADEAAAARLMEAPFDERLSMMGLLLDGLGEDFHNIYDMDFFTEQLFQILKGIKQELLDNKREPFLLMKEAGETLKEHCRREKEAGLTDRDKDRTMQKVISAVEEYGRQLKELGIQNGEEAFHKLKQSFDKENAAREAAGQYTSQRLTSAFVFLEKVFGSGTELVIFVTKLNANAYSVHFLNQYGNESYFRYNRELLFDEKEQELKQQIRDLKKVLEETSE